MFKGIGYHNWRGLARTVKLNKNIFFSHSYPSSSWNALKKLLWNSQWKLYPLLSKTGKTNSLIYIYIYFFFFSQIGKKIRLYIYKFTKDNKFRQFLFRILHCITEPTGIKNWKNKFRDIFFTDWEKNPFLYKFTKDNKFRKVRILHRLIITRKELFKFRLVTLFVFDKTL